MHLLCFCKEEILIFLLVFSYHTDDLCAFLFQILFIKLILFIFLPFHFIFIFLLFVFFHFQILYVTRNPKDTVVSFYHFSVKFIKNISLRNFQGTFDEYCQLFVEDLGNWCFISIISYLS